MALLILRVSAAPRLTHLTRSMSLYSALLVAHLIQHDARIAEDTLAQLLDLNGFSENQRAQIHLPIRVGGFGLLSPNFSQITGYFGSLAGCLQEVWHRVRSLNIMPGQANLPQFCELG